MIAKKGIPEVAVKKGNDPENVRRKRERRKEIVVARKRVTAETEEKER